MRALVLIRVGLDEKLSVLAAGEPSPAAAEDADGRFGHLLPKLVEAAEGPVGLLGQLIQGGAEVSAGGGAADPEPGGSGSDRGAGWADSHEELWEVVPADVAGVRDSNFRDRRLGCSFTFTFTFTKIGAGRMS